MRTWAVSAFFPEVKPAHMAEQSIVVKARESEAAEPALSIESTTPDEPPFDSVRPLQNFYRGVDREERRRKRAAYRSA